MPTVFDASTPRARKAHRCCECRGVIPPGEQYHLFTGLWDGRWDAYKTCEDCEKLRNKIAQGRRGGEWPAFGDLYDEVFDNAEEAPTDVRTFMETRRKRGAPESPRRWMEEREAEMTEGGTVE